LSFIGSYSQTSPACWLASQASTIWCALTIAWALYPCTQPSLVGMIRLSGSVMFARPAVA